MIRKLDKYLVINIALLGVVSSVFIHSTVTVFPQFGVVSNHGIKQAIFYGISFIVLIIMTNIDFAIWIKFRWYIYSILLVLLLMLFLAPASMTGNPNGIMREVNGAVSWFFLPGFALQPSEFMKFALILVFAIEIEKHNKKYAVQSFQSDVWLLTKLMVILAPVALLVYKQPDTGMVVLYLALLAPMIYLSGIQRKILIFFAAIPTAIIGFIVTAYFFFHDFYQEKLLGALSSHQISRINGWLHPFEFLDSSYQTRLGIMAIGTGKFEGKGYLGNTVYTPEKHTDFIFTTIAEEMGFLGGAFVLVLMFSLIYRIILITMQAETRLSAMIGASIASLFAFQIFQNIGMTMGLLPVTGITLPFISYGGSSLISNIMLISLVCLIKQSYDGLVFKSDNKE